MHNVSSRFERKNATLQLSACEINLLLTVQIVWFVTIPQLEAC